MGPLYDSSFQWSCNYSFFKIWSWYYSILTDLLHVEHSDLQHVFLTCIFYLQEDYFINYSKYWVKYNLRICFSILYNAKRWYIPKRNIYFVQIQHYRGYSNTYLNWAPKLGTQPFHPSRAKLTKKRVTLLPKSYGQSNQF